MTDRHWQAFSDGACRGNPGPGSYAYVIYSAAGDVLYEKAFYKPQTTNNQMELSGAIACFKRLEVLLVSGELGQERPRKVSLWTDSKYVVDGLKKWVPNWKKKNWKKKDGKEPINLGLWKTLDQLYHSEPLHSHVELYWIKGHAGHLGNERCDELCNQILDSH